MGNAPNSHPGESAGIWIQALTEDLGNMKTNNADLSPLQRDVLLAALKARFDANKARHPGLVWATVLARLEAKPDKLWSLAEMERTGGEPDVVEHDKKTGEIIFMDCAPKSPGGRRSVC